MNTAVAHNPTQPRYPLGKINSDAIFAYRLSSPTLLVTNARRWAHPPISRIDLLSTLRWTPVVQRNVEHKRPLVPSGFSYVPHLGLSVKNAMQDSISLLGIALEPKPKAYN